MYWHWSQHRYRKGKGRGEEWSGGTEGRGEGRKRGRGGLGRVAVSNIAEEFIAPLPIMWSVNSSVAYREKQQSTL